MRRRPTPASVVAAFAAWQAAAVLALALAPGACAKAPPDIAPAAARAFYGTQVIHDLDRIRDVAIAAHATSPPLLSSEDTLAVVTWHQRAIAIVHAAPAGWPQTVAVGLKQTFDALPQRARDVLTPYVTLAKQLLQEIPTP